MISYSAIQNDISFTGGDYVDKGGSSLEPHSDSELSTSSYEVYSFKNQLLKVSSLREKP